MFYVCMDWVRIGMGGICILFVVGKQCNDLE
jgi:hypothetical protein